MLGDGGGGGGISCEWVGVRWLPDQVTLPPWLGLVQGMRGRVTLSRHAPPLPARCGLLGSC